MIDTHSLLEAIARLLRSPTTGYNRDIILVCEALEAHLKPAPAFDKVAYQREYMRKRRVKRKIENAIAVQHELLWRSLCTGKLTQAEYENHASELKARAEEADI